MCLCAKSFIEKASTLPTHHQITHVAGPPVMATRWAVSPENYMYTNAAAVVVALLLHKQTEKWRRCQLQGFPYTTSLRVIGSLGPQAQNMGEVPGKC